MAMHVVVGKPINKADELVAEFARTQDISRWVVPRVAQAGDDVVFYMLNPTGAFVATGRVASDPEPGTSDQGDGSYLSDISNITMLPKHIERLTMAAQVPGWGWPTQPHTATTIPSDLEAEVNRVLQPR